MHYLGSKYKYVLDLLPILLKDRQPGQYYVEPFAGSFSIVCRVSGNRIASDNHRYLIALYKAIQSGWIPPNRISEDEYRDIRINSYKYPDHLVGFVGFGCSHSGKWWGGYARAKNRIICTESKISILSQRQGLQGIDIRCHNYWELEIPENSIIYCDPPYQGTIGYKTDFNHSHFWQWARLCSRTNKVFVSEYKAPNDFKCIWTKTVNCRIDQSIKQERLFIHEN
ncbi:MAG: DNA adenine methylase [Clostridia bacterium]|jgi:DNA adenine methylase